MTDWIYSANINILQHAYHVPNVVLGIWDTQIIEKEVFKGICSLVGVLEQIMENTE